MEIYFDSKDLPGISKIAFKSLKINRLVIFIICGILTLGLLWILSFWFDQIIELLYKDESKIMEARYIMFKKMGVGNEYVRLRRERCQLLPTKRERFYTFFFLKGTTFYFSNSKMKFRMIKGNFISYIQKKQLDIEQLALGIDKKTRRNLYPIHGSNKLTLKGQSLEKHVLHLAFYPSNFFQICISFSFFCIGRHVYSALVAIYVIIFISIKSYEYVLKVKKFKSISRNFEKFSVIRKNQNGDSLQKNIPASKICIGDVMCVPSDKKFPCDLLIIEGECLTNEAMLTGESLPVAKEAIRPKDTKLIGPKNLLYSGTFSTFNRTARVRGLVIGIGWNTTKGELLSSIAYEENAVLGFDRDFLVLIAFLFAINLTLIVLLLTRELLDGTFAWEKDIVKILQFIKNGFPPSLYVITVASLQISAVKLKRKEIGVFQMEKIIESGGISTIAYDKTGTLTENSMKMFGFLICQEAKFEACEKNLANLVACKNFRQFLETLSCCHSLVYFKGKLHGDPLEAAMFKSSNSQMVIEQIQGEDYCPTKIGFGREFQKLLGWENELHLRIIKIHEFSANRRKMSAILHNELLGELALVVKGAPESIKEICLGESLPPDFDETVIKYGKEGLRILAVAYKKLKSLKFEGRQKIDDESLSKILNNDEKNINGNDKFGKNWQTCELHQLENDLVFLGLILFENPIKAATIQTISQLNQNQFRQLIVSGDNIYTVANIAYQSGIMKQDQELLIVSASQSNSNSNIKIQEYNSNSREKFSDEQKIDEGGFEFCLSPKTFAWENLPEMEKIVDQILSTCFRENKKLAFDGNSFQFLLATLKSNQQKLNQLLKLTKAFGHCTADQKKLIIEAYKKSLRQENQCIAFVGDGSNDCGALKAANVGLMIGNDESCLAAPFTSSRENISPVIDVILEGKACLANALQNFKFLMCSNLMICFVIFLLNNKKLAINQFDYVYAFLFNFPFSLLMTLGGTNAKLNCFKIEPTLLTKQNLLSVFITLVVSFFFLELAICLLSEFSIYKPVNQILENFNPKTFSVGDHFFVENKLMFFFMNSLTIVVAIACYAGFPFKVSFIKNPFVMLYTAATTIFILFNILAECVLDRKWLKFFVRQGRQPIYQIGELVKFWVCTGLMLFVMLFLNFTLEKILLYKQIMARKGQTLQKKDFEKGEVVVNSN